MQDEVLLRAHLPLRVGHLSLFFQGRQILVSRKATLHERGMPEHCLTCMVLESPVEHEPWPAPSRCIARVKLIGSRSVERMPGPI